MLSDFQGEKETTERSLEAFAASMELLRKLEHVVIPDAAFLYTSGPLKVRAGVGCCAAGQAGGRVLGWGGWGVVR